MNFLKRNVIVLSLIIINLFLIYYCSVDKGRGAFIAFPSIFLINIFSLVFGILKKNTKLAIASLIVFFVSPLLGFVVFTVNFPWIAH